MKKGDIKQQLFEINHKLISFQTTEEKPAEVKKAYDYIRDLLKGSEVKVEEYEQEGKKSLVLHRGVKNRKNFKFIFLCHIDVVPAKEELFVPRVVGNKLYGRGSMDMKAGCAVGLMLMKNIPNKDFAVIYTSDEEIGGKNGTAFLVKKGYRAQFVIALESTKCNVMSERKGALRVVVTAKGKTVHSSLPWGGVNSLDKLISVYEEVKQGFPVITKKNSDDEKYQKTLNLALMKGGDVFNKVPDDATMYLDVRYSKEENPEDILKDIRKIVKKHKCKIERSWYTPTLFTDKNNKYIQRLLKISKGEIVRGYGASDSRYFSQIGVPAIDFGAKGKHAHGENEYVEISSLKKVYDILEKFLNLEEK
jgi:succinyl-diaminopimelate desuccinylase